MQLLKLDRNRLGLVVLLVGLSLGGLVRSVSARAVQADLTLEAETSPSFDNLMQQAELLAEKSLSQAFDQSEVTEVLIRISGDRAGQSVPLLTVRATRSDWQKDPSLRSYARYHYLSARLLSFATQITPVSVTTPVDRFTRKLQNDPNFQDD